MTAQKPSFKKVITMVVFLFVIAGALAYSGVFSNAATAKKSKKPVVSPIVLTATPTTVECKTVSNVTGCGSVTLVASAPAFPFSPTLKKVFGYFKVSTDENSWVRVIGNPGYTLTESRESTQRAEDIMIKAEGKYAFIACLYADQKITSKSITGTCSQTVWVTAVKIKSKSPVAVGNIVITPDKGEIEANAKISVTLKASDDIGLKIGEIYFSKQGHDTDWRKIDDVFKSIEIQSNGTKEWTFSWNKEFPGWKVDKDKDVSGTYNVKISFKDADDQEGHLEAKGAIIIEDTFVARLRKLGISDDDIGKKEGPSGSIQGYMAANGITEDDVIPVVEKLENVLAYDTSNDRVDPLAQIKGFLVVYRGMNIKNNFFATNDPLSIDVNSFISMLKNVEIKVGTNNKVLEKVAEAAPGFGICLLGGAGNISSGGMVGVGVETALNSPQTKEYIKSNVKAAGKWVAKMVKKAESIKIDFNDLRSESDVIKRMALNDYTRSRAEYASSYYLFSSIGVIKNGILDTTKVKHFTNSKGAVGTTLGNNNYKWDDKIFLPRDRAWLLEWAIDDKRKFDVLGLAKKGASSDELNKLYAPLIKFYREQSENGAVQFLTGNVDVNKIINSDIKFCYE